MKAPKLPKPGKEAKQNSFEARVQADIDQIRGEIAEVARGGGHVVAGPFTSEVGFELLYWIPLLRWALHEFPELAGRTTVISRGGVSSWLAGLDVGYVDLFEVSSVEELMRRRESLKQREVTPFERDVISRARAFADVPDGPVLHPGVLFNLYYRVLKIERHGFARSVTHTERGVEGLAARFAPIPRPAPGPLAGILPAEYTAVRFYFRPSFPDSPENRAFAGEALAALSQHAPVVLLNNGLELDDHFDFLPDDDRLVRIDHLMRPEDNLAVQTAAIAGARAFVGTYGGLAYLAPLLGVPSLAFSSQPEHTHPWHLDLAQRVFEQPGCADIVSLRPRDLALVGLLSGGASEGLGRLAGLRR